MSQLDLDDQLSQAFAAEEEVPPVVAAPVAEPAAAEPPSDFRSILFSSTAFGPFAGTSRGRSVSRSFVREAIGTGGGVVGGVAEPVEYFGLGTGDNFRNAGQSIREFAQEEFPTRPDLQGSFWWDALPGMFGSAGAFLLVGAGAAVTGGGAIVVGGTIAATGFLLSASEGRQRLQPYVDDGTMTAEQATKGAVVSGIPGFAEAINPFRVLKLLGKKPAKEGMDAFLKLLTTKAGRVKIGKEAAIGFVTEAFQEGVLGTIALNVIEGKFSGKDVELLKGFIPAAGGGGITGAVMSAVATAIGLSRRSVRLGGFTKNETRVTAGAKLQIQMALDKGIIRPSEVQAIRDDNALMYRLAEARLSNREAEIEERTDAEGKVTRIVRSRPDNVLWTERVALKHNENLINSLQTTRRKGGVTLEDIFERDKKGEPSLIFPFSKELGYLKSPEKLTDDLRMRQIIGRTQERFIQDIKATKSAEHLSPSEKTLTLLRLDAEHAARIDRVLRKDDNKAESAKTEMLREISEVVEPEKQSTVSDSLLASIDKVIKGKPLGTQRDIVEGLLDTVTDPVGREVIESLHRKILTDFRRRPWSERVGMGMNQLRNLQEAISRDSKFVTQLLKRKKEMRLNLVKIAQTLPPEGRGSLLKVIAKVETAKEFGVAVQAIHDAQIKYARSAATDSIVKAAKRIEKNPRKKEALKLLVKSTDGKPIPTLGQMIPDPDTALVVDDLGFFSQVEKVVLEKVSGRITFSQLRATLKKSGVRDDEMNWLGLLDLFAEKTLQEKFPKAPPLIGTPLPETLEALESGEDKFKITKEDLLDYIRQNRLTLVETVRETKSQDDLRRTTDLAEATGAVDSHIITGRQLIDIALKIPEISPVERREKALGHALHPDRQAELDFSRSMASSLTVTIANATLDSSPSFEVAIKEAVRRSVVSTGVLDRFSTVTELEKSLDTSTLRQWYANLVPLLRRQSEALAADSIQDGAQFGSYTLPGGTNYREVLLRLPEDPSGVAFKSGHFAESNVVAHVRLKDRKTVDGKKILFVEEIQSDWMQRIQGTFGAVITISPISPRSVGETRQVVTPFQKTWHELAMRRVLRMAVEGGYDGVSWTTGNQQAERYSGAAGPGLAAFYDKIIPQYMKRLGKRFGAELQSGKGIEPIIKSEIEETLDRFEGNQVLPITDQMRKSLEEEGQRIFQAAPPPREFNDTETAAQEAILNAPLTKHEEQKLEISLDPERFSQLTPEHRRLNERLKELEKLEVWTEEDSNIIRYLFADAGPNLLERIGSIKSAELGLRTGAQIDLLERPLITINKNVASMGIMRANKTLALLHEIGHVGYYAYLSLADVNTLRRDHRQLLDTRSTKGYNNLAEEVIGEGALTSINTKMTQDELDYFSSNPQEFFAQLFGQDLLGNRVPLSAYARMFEKVRRILLNALQRLVRKNVFAESTVPQTTLDLITKVQRGVEPSVGLTEAQRREEVAEGRIERELLRAEREGESPLRLGQLIPEGEPPKPTIIKDSTGKLKVSITNLRKNLKNLSADEIKLLDNQLRDIIRKGQIEKGLFAKFIRFQSQVDSENATAFLAEKALKSDWWRERETVRDISKLAFDPVTVEGWLFQISNSNEDGPLYQMFFKQFVEPYSQTKRNEIETRKTMEVAAKKHLGMTSKSTKFTKYITKRLENGIFRGEAMWAYALDKDEGRHEAVRRDGIRSRDNDYNLEESIALLSEADKAFVDDTKRYFQNNDFIEKAFKNFLLLHGYEAERSPAGWFTSRRGLEPTRLAEGENDFALHIITETNALKERDPNLRGTPFRLDGGYVAAFYQVSDRMSTYAELGLGMFRAEKLLNDPKFTHEFRRKYGDKQLDRIKLYLRNILGMIGHNPSAIDVAFTYIPQVWLAGKITGNVMSAIRQTFSLMTILGDDIIDTKALLQASVEVNSFGLLSRGVGKRMREASGVAAMRLDGGRFAEQILVLGDKKANDEFTFLQNKAFFLQRIMDDYALRISFRAAEIMAKKRGLTGDAAVAFARGKFEQSLMRNQATNSPLYASGMELEAKRHPSLRGILSLQRELNRLYNVPRRHVVKAAQHPTRENIMQAGSSLFFVGFANTAASVGLNLFRHSIWFGLPAWGAGELMRRYLQDLAGRWYLLGDAAGYFLELVGPTEGRFADDRLLSPAGQIVGDTLTSLWHVLKAVNASQIDPDDPERYLSSGIRRGQDKAAVEFEKAVDKGMSSLSSVTGMPFWALYYQGKGTYNWFRNDYRLMVHVETEWAQLRKDDQELSPRGQQITALRKRINRIHRSQENGNITKESAKSLITQELELDSLIKVD